MQHTPRDLTLLRITVAFAVGILFADIADARDWQWPAFVSLAVASLLFAAGVFMGLWSRRLHAPLSVTGGVCLTVSFVLFGCWAWQHHCGAIRTVWPSEPMDYKARVVSPPQVRQRNVRYEVEIADHRVYLYVADSDTVTFLPGDSLQLSSATIRPPENFSTTLSFDYARSLLHKGIAGTGFVKAGEVTLLSSGHRSGFFALTRQRLSERYALDPLLGEKEQGVIRALTLGDRSALSEELRADYASAGVSHVLALSGLHVGILFMLLTACFRPLFQKRQRWIGEGLSLLAVWVFALLTGASPSILRAVLMCTIYAMAACLSSDRAPLAALFLAAMILLCVNPFMLFDVGFELSFAAMCAILWLTPKVDDEHKENRSKYPLLWKLVDYVVGVVVVSLIAQAGTLPLTLHYFGRFSTCFLLSNLLVIPLTTLTLLAAVAWWLCSFLPFHWSVPGYLLNGCVRLMNHSATAVATLPGSSVVVDDFGWCQVVLAYLALFFLVRFCHKKPGALIGVVACFILLFALHLWM